MNQLLTVSLRQSALFIPETAMTAEVSTLRETTAVLAANLARLGYGLSEPLLKALNNTTPSFQVVVLEKMKTLTGVNKNWTPLVKGWDTPTGESFVDHVITWFSNLFKMPGTVLPCGHTIPANTFPLHRYNGCPFCGTPFEAGVIEHYKQGSEQKLLELWTISDASAFLQDLLQSKTALDATQMDSLQILLTELPMPTGISIGMKETQIAVIDFYRGQEQPEKAAELFTSPTDILRYLWYKHTGFLQLIEPATIIKRSAKNAQHLTAVLNNSGAAKLAAESSLRLKYSRKDCITVAGWLNSLDLDADKACEMMHPKRGMWVRFIRALRLAEYSKRKGFEKLALLLDTFYKEEYEVWQAHVDQFRLRYDAPNTFRLLQQRPGLFARSLFANMLWFGSKETVAAFAAIISKVPARLVFTLDMYADTYFDSGSERAVKPLGGITKRVPSNRLLNLYTEEQLAEMKAAVSGLCRMTMQQRFAAKEVTGKTMYIDPALFTIPVSISDRGETIQDIPGAVSGSRFAVAGDSVRLFMQWGNGLPAQPMDMDLSCVVQYPEESDICSFSSLSITGCKHSGDIRSIPEKTGTAEYIEIDLPKLKSKGAQYVSFCCNAYESGRISPNLVIGWMNSHYPMKISSNTGVAYDPSCVQHQVRVMNGLSKGMVFGVLNIETSEITWLEMPFHGQTVHTMGRKTLETMLKKLRSKLSIGEALTIKAEAQQLQLVNTPEADEAYTKEWARNTAAVTRLLLD